MNPLIDELFSNLELEYEPESEDPYEEDEEDEEDEDDQDDNGLSFEEFMELENRLAGVLARHYHRQGVIGDPDSFMSAEWELEMGPEFAEARDEANANAEGADSSAPDASVDAYFGELGAEAGHGEGAGDGGESGGGDGPSISFDFGDFGGGSFGGDFGGFGGGGS